MKKLMALAMIFITSIMIFGCSEERGISSGEGENSKNEEISIKENSNLIKLVDDISKLVIQINGNEVYYFDASKNSINVMKIISKEKEEVTELYKISNSEMKINNELIKGTNKGIVWVENNNDESVVKINYYNIEENKVKELVSSSKDIDEIALDEKWAVYTLNDESLEIVNLNSGEGKSERVDKGEEIEEIDVYGGMVAYSVEGEKLNKSYINLFDIEKNERVTRIEGNFKSVAIGKGNVYAVDKVEKNYEMKKISFDDKNIEKIEVDEKLLKAGEVKRSGENIFISEIYSGRDNIIISCKTGEVKESKNTPAIVRVLGEWVQYIDDNNKCRLKSLNEL